MSQLPVTTEPDFFKPCEVLPYTGLWIGPQSAARSPTLLTSISALIAVNGVAPPPWPTGVHVHVVDIDDHTSEDILAHVPSVFEAINSGRAARGALVHCTMGISRSAAFVCAYIMLLSRVPLDDALAILRRARRWVRPNDGFLCQLRHLESMLLHPGATALPMTCDAHSGAEGPCPLVPRAVSTALGLHDDCDLCALQRRTTWYDSTHPLFVVLQCDACDCPMMVVRQHGVPWQTLPPRAAAEALKSLADAARTVFGGVHGWHMDPLQRSVPFHAHVHVRRGAAPQPMLDWFQSIMHPYDVMSASPPRPRI